ncbi:trigger factor [Sandaracinus amylolyticus]|uniref:Trigger factor n=1 Tax=Sandaracinus amylolyticus TaxID=927083 RepID=A0A0F6YIY3_9BACT|nr:trigger factor [Sandaracinus amylolyticus]AKF06291.1 Cell division trigger factor [Sandaracinus amylolyticus]
MQSQVSEIDPVTVEIQVEVPWDRVQKNLDETFTKLQRTARIKGFRPGKAPRNVLQRLFSKDVQAEVVSNLVEESVVQAVQQHSIPVVSQAMMDARPELTQGQPLTFKVKFEVRPKVENLETTLELTRTPATVSDAEIEQEIERLRQQHAIVRPIEGERAAQKGDVLIIDYAVTIDGEAKPDMKGENRTVNLGEGRLLDEIDAGLVGAKVGEKKNIEIARGDDDANKELAGKKVVFEVDVKELRERVLPDVDDEFAKDVGEYETLADLRTKLRARLEESAKARSESQLREQAVEKLAEKNPIPVPPSLVDQQLRAMLQEYMQIMQMLGQQPDFGKDGFDEMRKRAETKVRAALLLGELSRKAEISVAADEVEAKMREMAEKTGKHIAKVKADYAGEKREQLETQILEDKLIKHLLERATITDAAPTSSESAASAAAT